MDLLLPHLLWGVAVRLTFAAHRRDGRVVDCGGLENRCTARYRGFESLHFRNIGLVVQLVRIPACHAGGREFESRPDRNLFKIKK